MQINFTACQAKLACIKSISVGHVSGEQTGGRLGYTLHLKDGTEIDAWDYGIFPTLTTEEPGDA